MKRGDTIYIRGKSNSYLQCEVSRVTDAKVEFTVVNGGWDGYFDLNQNVVRVLATRENVPAEIVYTKQDIRGFDYNTCIEKVKEKLNDTQQVPKKKRIRRTNK